MKLNGLEKHFKTNKLIGGIIVDYQQTIHYDFENIDITPLMFVFLDNKSEKLNLNYEQFDYLIKNSNLKQVDFDGWSPLMLALVNNKTENLNLSSEHLDYLIKNSDLKQINKFHKTALLYALENNKSQNLNLNNEQFDYLMQNSNLNNPHLLSYIFSNFTEKNIKYNLQEKQYTYIIENSDLNIYIDKISLIKLILEDSLFLKEIGENNKNYLMSKFPEFIKNTKEVNLEDKVISLEEEVKDLKSIIKNLADTNKLILEKLNSQNTNKKII